MHPQGENYHVGNENINKIEASIFLRIHVQIEVYIVTMRVCMQVIHVTMFGKTQRL